MDWIEYNWVVLGFMLATVAILRIFFHKKRWKNHSYYIRNAERMYRVLNGEGFRNNGPAKFAYLRRINPYVFEELVLLAFEKKGYKVIRNKRYSGDGGLDGQVVIDGKRIPIQAKRYRTHIRKEHVEAFSFLVDKKKVPYGLFVHTGRTGKGSNTFNYPNIRMVSGDKLLELLYRSRK